MSTPAPPPAADDDRTEFRPEVQDPAGSATYTVPTRPRAQRGPWWWWLLLAIAVLPILSAGWSRQHRHWYPEGDDATIVMLSHDTFSTHPPQLGMVSTGGAQLADPELHHPGAIELYLLAPFGLRSSTVPGVVVGSVLVSVAAVLGLALALRALGGIGLSTAGIVTAALVLWGLGGDVPASVWNPFIVALPFATFLALAVATVARRRTLLPWVLGVGSFVMQTHLSYVGMVGLISAWTVGAVAWGWFRHAGQRDGGSRLALESVGVLAVLWAVPVWQQLTGHPGNLSQIVRSAWGGGGPTARGSGLGELGRVVGLPLIGLRPRPDIVRVFPPLSAASLLAYALPWIAVAVLGAIGWRHRDTVVTRTVATIAVILVSASLTAMRIPLSDGVLYQYYALWMWPLGALVWLLLGWCTYRLWAPAALAKPLAPRVALAGVGGLLGLVAVISVLPRPGAWAPWAAYRRVAGATVPDAVAGLAPGAYVVRFQGGTAYLSTGSAVAEALEQHGHTAYIDPGVPTRVFPWTERRRYANQPVAGELWVVSGASPANLPADAKLLTTVPTLTPAERAQHQRDQAVLAAAVADHGLVAGPRQPASAADRTLLAKAQADPDAALADGTVALLAAKGLIEPPGGDLHRVFTAARMAALADEKTVRVYLVR